jgi:thioredoxin-like negative regulator of GroEL
MLMLNGIEELNRGEAEKLLAESRNDQRWAVFLYTPLCGTCKAASRMLEVVLAIEPGLPLAQANINSVPELAQGWKVTSVPCIVISEPFAPLKKVYAMHSVEALLDHLRPLKPA